MGEDNAGPSQFPSSPVPQFHSSPVHCPSTIDQKKAAPAFFGSRFHIKLFLKFSPSLLNDELLRHAHAIGNQRVRINASTKRCDIVLHLMFSSRKLPALNGFNDAALKVANFE